MGDGSWTIGVLAAGSENVRRVAAGEEDTEHAAIEAASDAAMVVVNDRGRAEYWLTVARTQMMLIPGLTGDGEVDLCDVRDAVLSIARR